MKRILGMGAVAALCAALFIGLNSASAAGAAKQCPANAKGQCASYVDANGDGVCDNFVDANGDGVCDNRPANAGKGKGPHAQNGKRANFVDANGDGVCDNKGTCDGTNCSATNPNFVDANNDGVCDNWSESKGTKQCDGSQSRQGQRRGQGSCPVGGGQGKMQGKSAAGK